METKKTKKMELVTEVLTLMSDIREYEGKEAMATETLEELTKKKTRETIVVLEDEVVQLLEARERARREYYRKMFYNSDRGKELRNEYETACEAWKKGAYEQTIATVEEVLGDNWAVKNWNCSSFVVGMKGNDEILFGHDFTVRCGLDLTHDFKAHKYNRMFKFQTNIGTMGAFDIDVNDSQTTFYIGIGKFLASPKTQELKKVLEQLHTNLEGLEDIWNKAETAYVEAKMKGDLYK